MQVCPKKDVDANRLAAQDLLVTIFLLATKCYRVVKLKFGAVHLNVLICWQ